MRMAGLQKAGGAAGGADSAAMERMKSARKMLQKTVETSQTVAADLEGVQSRLQSIQQRLPELDAAMQPIRERSSDTNALARVLDEAIAPAAIILQNYDAMQALEGRIRGNPREDLGAYLLAFSQLQQIVPVLSASRSSAVQKLREAVQLVESRKAADDGGLHRLKEALAAVRALNGGGPQAVDRGLTQLACGKLEKEFSRLLSENAKAIPLAPPVKLHENRKSPPLSLHLPLPLPVVQKLQAIARRMHANAESDRCARAFIQSRGATLQQSVAMAMAAIPAPANYLQLTSARAVDTLDWATLESLIGSWTHDLEPLVKILYAGERQLCCRIFDCFSSRRVSLVMAELAHTDPGMASFLQFGESVALSHKSPEKLFKLLDIFDTLQNLHPTVGEVFDGDGCQPLRHRLRELMKQIVHSSSQVFRELGTQVEAQKDLTLPLPSDASTLKLCSYVVNYIKYLVSEFYSPLMHQVLQIEQSWRGGSPKESALASAVQTLMDLLEKTLVARSKGYKDPSQGHVFLINNYFYLLSRSRGCELGPLLGNSWLKDCRSKVQQQALAYQKEGWGKLISHLSRDGLFLSTNNRVASRDLVKQRLKTFTTLFEETFHQHQNWMIADADLKEQMKTAVIQAVIPAYRSYIQNYGPLLEMTGSSSKYIKFSAEDLEHKLKDLFHDKIQKTSSGIPSGFHANGSS